MQYVTRSTDLRRPTLRSAARRIALDALSFADRVRSVRSAGRLETVQFLLLHHVFDDEVAEFRQLLNGLAKTYQFVSYSRAINLVRRGGVRSPTLAVSFDDGLLSCVRASYILEEFGISACFFVCPGVVGEKRLAKVADFCRAKLAMPPTALMDWDQLASLQSRGHEIGGHTVSHACLANLSPQRAHGEIAQSREMIVRRLGGCSHFAWPYGFFHHSNPSSAAAAFAAGFTSCASGVRGAHAAAPGVGDSPWIVRREPIVARWPLRHIEYFLNRSRRQPMTYADTAPANWLAHLATQRSASQAAA